MIAETMLYVDWFYAAGFLLSAWSLAVARNEVFETTNPSIVGTIVARIPIPWSFFSFNSTVTKALFTTLALIGASAFVAGLVSPFVAGEVVIASVLTMLSFAAGSLVLAFQYCKRPYTLILGSDGFSWHGKSYHWKEITAWVDRTKRTFQVRVIANEQNQLYGAVNYLDLSTVTEGNLELLDRVARENAGVVR